MNYFTKEWYELCQKTGIHLILEEEEEAEAFSEEYFQQLYCHKLSEWLDLQKEMSEITFEDLYPMELNAEYLEKNISEAEIAVLKDSYQVARKTAKEKYRPLEPFDIEEQIKQFHEAFVYNQEHMKNVLPEELLESIADIRVFALEKASRQVIAAVTKLCEGNEKVVRRVNKEYEIYYKKVLASLEAVDRAIFEEIKFHDCIIIDIKQTETSLSILFDNSGGFTDISEVVFENYRIIEKHDSLIKACWLYEEIYKIDGRYEVQALLYNKNMELEEFIISAEHISLRNNNVLLKH
jgi:hypothetical protein